MTYHEKLVEFSNIKTLNKFLYNSNIFFSDGSMVGYWFKKNKDLIMSSKDEFSLLIKKQYEEFISRNDHTIETNSISSYNYQLLRNKVAKEFLEEEDLSKFNHDSNLTLKNGMRMYTWYNYNKSIIETSTREIYVEIRKQLIKKQMQEENKRKLLDSKKRLLFFKHNNINKFNIDSRITFFDGTDMGKWYQNNEGKISKSNSPIDIEIMKQKDLYDIYVELIEEFVLCPFFDKFNLDGNVRFTSGALMCLFFEKYYDDIMNSSDKYSKMIVEQYNKYKEDNNIENDNSYIKRKG